MNQTSNVSMFKLDEELLNKLKTQGGTHHEEQSFGSENDLNSNSILLGNKALDYQRALEAAKNYQQILLNINSGGNSSSYKKNPSNNPNMLSYLQHDTYNVNQFTLASIDEGERDGLAFTQNSIFMQNGELNNSKTALTPYLDNTVSAQERFNSANYNST